MTSRQRPEARSVIGRLLTRFAVLMTLVVGALTLNPGEAEAQLDTRHWFPTLWSSDAGQLDRHYIVVSTPEVEPVPFTVTSATGQVILNSTVSNAQPVVYQIGRGQGAVNVVAGRDALNTVHNEGLILNADRPVYATIRHRLGAQGLVLTGKGRKALGQDFRVGVMRGALRRASYRGSFVSVMATEDNTTITLSDFKPGLILTDTQTEGNPATTRDLTVRLDANETYVVGIRDANYTGSANINDLNGARVTSDRPVAVVSGSWLQGIGSSTGQDIGADQLVPVQAAGTEYVLIQGNAPRSSNMETPILVAVSPNTNVFVNGGANPVNPAPMQPGDYIFLDDRYSQNNHGNMLVQTDRPALMYQTMAGSSSTATPGFIFLPPLGADAATFVDNIPSVELVGTARIGIVARAGAQVLLNGAPINVAPLAVPGTNEWVTYKTNNLDGDVAIESDGAVAVTLYNVSGAIGAAGYFSGFAGADVDLDNDGVSDGVDNCPDLANADQVDTDNDGAGDACDGCPNDPGKAEPGVCGCGEIDGDPDNDGAVCDDNCPFTANADQADADGDGVGDLCEDDGDGDGVPDPLDGCPADPNKSEPLQCGCGLPETDADFDGLANCVDNCPAAPNPDQADFDGDGQGDPCDGDADGDGVSNVDDAFPNDPDEDTDTDGDGIGDNSDPDADGDGIPDFAFSGPGVYQDAADSPFAGETFSAFYFEDCEDADLNTPGISASAGGASSAAGIRADSVDGDDCTFDGVSNGDAFYAPGDSVTFSFDDAVLGRLPTHVGLVWTDGCAGQVTFEAFDGNDNSLGTTTYDAPNGADDGASAEDRFFGITAQVGISAVTLSGQAGCGIEVDHIQYGIADPDGAPFNPLPGAADADADGTNNCADNCAALANPGQGDADGDGAGDACDPDADDDGLANGDDNCPLVASVDQADFDGDGQGDVCDVCPGDAANDVDEDGVCGDVDNCPLLANADQLDDNGDGFGDACISPDAVIDPGVEIAPGCVIGAGVVIEADCILEPNCLIEPGAVIRAGATVASGATIGAGAELGEGCVVGPDCVVGANCEIGPQAVLGGGSEMAPGTSLGEGSICGENSFLGGPVGASCVIGDDVNLAVGSEVQNGGQVGSGSSIGAGTVIEANGAVGNNCVIGNDCVVGNFANVRDGANLANNVTVGDGGGVGRNTTVGAGSTIRGQVGDGASIGAGCFTGNGSDIGDGCVLGANAAVGNLCVVGNGTTLGEDVAVFDGASIGSGCGIGEGTLVLYNASIGDNTNLGADGYVDERATVGDNVTAGDRFRFWLDVVIGNGVTMGNQVLVGVGTVVGQNANLQGDNIIHFGCDIGAGATVGTGVELLPESVVAPGATVTVDD